VRKEKVEIEESRRKQQEELDWQYQDETKHRHDVDSRDIEVRLMGLDKEMFQHVWARVRDYVTNHTIESTDAVPEILYRHARSTAPSWEQRDQYPRLSEPTRSHHASEPYQASVIDALRKSFVPPCQMIVSVPQIVV
jgi:hypothetical protein